MNKRLKNSKKENKKFNFLTPTQDTNMKSKITSTPTCEIKDDHGHAVMIQPEFDDNGNIFDYLIEGNYGATFICSDTDELRRFGERIIEYAEVERKRLHDKNNKQ